jgi:probable rRNA maturation factor
VPIAISIAIADEQERLQIDGARLRSAVTQILKDAGIASADISLALVDDATIHEVNRQYLGHDYPTDVISFVLDHTDGRLEGEVIVSADTAAATAARLGWPPENEVLLYVVHGALHLVGHDDQDPASLAAMRNAERQYLARFGLKPPYEETT